MSGYLYDDPRDCISAGAHLKRVDRDGFCEACGHQESPEDLGVKPPKRNAPKKRKPATGPKAARKRTSRGGRRRSRK